jgi:hypothetical protein
MAGIWVFMIEKKLPPSAFSPDQIRFHQVRQNLGVVMGHKMTRLWKITCAWHMPLLQAQKLSKFIIPSGHTQQIPAASDLHVMIQPVLFHDGEKPVVGIKPLQGLRRIRAGLGGMSSPQIKAQAGKAPAKVLCFLFIVYRPNLDPKEPGWLFLQIKVSIRTYLDKAFLPSRFLLRNKSGQPLHSVPVNLKWKPFGSVNFNVLALLIGCYPLVYLVSHKGKGQDDNKGDSQFFQRGVLWGHISSPVGFCGY